MHTTKTSKYLLLVIILSFLFLAQSDYENWKKNGSKTMSDRVKERTDELLRTHEPEPIEDKLKQELHKIIDDADKRHS